MSPIILRVLILFVVFALSPEVPKYPPGILVVDEFQMTRGIVKTPAPYPLTCPAGRHTIQVVWRTDEKTDYLDARVVAESIATRVNGVFWRDSNSYTEAKVPAWKMDSECRLDILYVPYGADFPMLENTKYLVIEPMATDYCGKAIIQKDDSPGIENRNNGTSIGWVSGNCNEYYTWGHEILHQLGAVQLSSPDSDGAWHSRVFDIMGRPAVDICHIHDMVDCQSDGYFGFRHAPGAYLLNHWNVANSPYLISVPKYVIILPLVMSGGYD